MFDINPQVKADLMKPRLELAKQMYEKCLLCPRECEVNRTLSEKGVCKIGSELKYSSANLHYGEEPPISGWRGSGTIFLTGCNLRCNFCQNYPISQLQNGNIVSPEILANHMLRLQKAGAHNINFVTPTHQASAIFESLYLAYCKGLSIPLVYNSSGYESIEMLKLLEGVIDVYMPDSKYGDDKAAKEISNAPDYVVNNRAALKEMFRLVGMLEMDEEGIATKGLLIRHLVLPADYSGTDEVLRFISEEISQDTYISLMSQYFPAWRGSAHHVLNRRLREVEYDAACESLEKYGLHNGWTQPYEESL